MNSKEKLHQYAYDNNVNVYDFYLGEDNLKGLYIDGNIAINTSVKTSVEESCVMAEELGHHFTSVGNILATDKIENQKQELRARMWGYDKLIGLTGILKCYKHGCRNLHEMAEYLEVTEEYLEDMLEAYRRKYGVFVTVGDYTIYFEPQLAVLRMN